MIEINDPVYTFNEVVAHIDLNRYFAEKDCRTGRPRYDREKLLKVVLFAFMERGYPSLCRTTEIDEGRMSVEIDKRRCGFKLTAPYSEKRRRAIREAGKAKGIHTRLKKERDGARE